MSDGKVNMTYCLCDTNDIDVVIADVMTHNNCGNL